MTITPGTITGTVTTSATPPAGAKVEALVSDDTTIVAATATTAANGTYTLALAPGSYVVRFSAAGSATAFNGGAVSLSAASPLGVAANATVTANADLAPQALLSATLLASAEPVTGITVLAKHTGTSETAGQALTDATGHFSITGLHTGTYRLMLTTGGEETYWLPDTYTATDHGTIDIFNYTCTFTGWTSEGEPDYSGANLAGCNLSGADLSFANFTNADLHGANFTGAWLEGANFTGANFTNAGLISVRSTGIIGSPAALPSGWALANGYLVGQGVTLTGANLTGGDLTGVDLRGAYLSGADLTGATLTGAVVDQDTDLRTNKLTGVTSGGITGYAPVAWPEQLLIPYTFRGGYLIGPGVNLANANLDGVVFGNDDLTGVTSGGITGTPLGNYLPYGWSLRGGYLIGPGANLTDANLTGAVLTGANLSGAYLERTDLTNADLSGANLTGATLSTVTLSTVNLSGANLTGAVLTWANLTDADLSGATLTGVVSYGITGTEYTLPAGWSLVDGTLVYTG